MPNIEIIGYTMGKGGQIAESLWGMFFGDPESKNPLHRMKDEVVITKHDGVIVTNAKSRNCPYLRISATKIEDLDEIVAALKQRPEAFDIELVLLHGFVQTKATTGNGRTFGVPT